MVVAKTHWWATQEQCSRNSVLCVDLASKVHKAALSREHEFEIAADQVVIRIQHNAH